jgi:hypothetical protein
MGRSGETQQVRGCGEPFAVPWRSASRTGKSGCHPPPVRYGDGRMTTRVLFIAGLGRSGSTLLERALGELDGVAPLGEVYHLWYRGAELNETCGCGKAFHNCPRWQAIGEAAFGGWAQADVARIEHLKHSIDRLRCIPRILARRWSPSMAAAVAEYTSYYQAVYAAATQTTGTTMVIDSSKHASLAYCLTTRDDLDLRVLQVVRDPRAVAYSWTKSVRRPEAGPYGDEWMTGYRPAHTALLWDSQNLALNALRRSAADVRLLKYEDFVASPRETIAGIAQWVGLETSGSSPVSTDGTITLTETHTVSGNPMRFQTGSIPIVRHEEWRTELAPLQRRVVSALTLPLMAQFGYSPFARESSPQPRKRR